MKYHLHTFNNESDGEMQNIVSLSEKLGDNEVSFKHPIRIILVHSWLITSFIDSVSGVLLLS